MAKESRLQLIGRKLAEIVDDEGKVPSNVIELHSGAFVDPFDLDPELVFVEDIAHNLARIARFTGCSNSYDAEHALIVESILTTCRRSALERLHGILHDGHEAYLNDTPKPVKYRPEYAFYREACDRAQAVIYSGLGLPTPTPGEAAVIKHADNISLLVEARRGLPSRGESWKMTTPELVDEACEWELRLAPTGLSHEELEAKFLREYFYLRREAGV
jgi:hypothetical protein